MSEPIDKKQLQRAWDERAPSWDQRSKNMWDHGSRKSILPFIEKHIPKKAKMIDIGCGSGYGTYKLFQAGYHAVGVDLSEKMIEFAMDKFSDTSIHFFHADMDDLINRGKQYDGIMAINVLEWVNHPASSLQVCKQILTKNGYLCIGILGPTAAPRKNSFRRLYGEDVIMNTMMPWEFIEIAKENHFELIDHFGVYKKEVKPSQIEELPLELKQALSFMWVFMLRNG